MTTRRIGTIVAIGLAVVVASGCRKDEDTERAPDPVVDLIRPAIAAVEDELGGPQRYFEVNANAQLVNVVVARPNAFGAAPSLVGYAYLAGELAPAKDLGEAPVDETFGAADIPELAASLFDPLHDDLPDSAISAFVLSGTDDALRYDVVVTSAAGGRLDVTIDDTGEVLAVDPA